MRCGRSHPVRVGPVAAGFTLIELLVVIAVISVLMAILLAALHRARVIAYRVVCGSKLKQIAFAWHTYLADSHQRFLQEGNADTYFGGWKGVTTGAVERPLNRYVGLPTVMPARAGAELFRCPADQGDEDYGPVAYLIHGNSYQANLMLIGGPLSVFEDMPEALCRLNQEINKRRRGLRADMVCDSARLLLVGDHNWVRQWDALIDASGRSWHGLAERYDLAFFDGHVALVNVHKGVYMNSDYLIQPFPDLDRLTRDVQNQMVREAGGEP